MFGVAFKLYQGSGVAGLVALARPCCCRLWVGSVAPRLRPWAAVSLLPKLVSRLDFGSLVLSLCGYLSWLKRLANQILAKAVDLVSGVVLKRISKFRYRKLPFYNSAT